MTTAAFPIATQVPHIPSMLTCLFVLALPLEAEGLVDKELAEKRDEGHDDGDTVIVSDHLFVDPPHRGMGTYPRTRTAGHVSIFVGVECVGSDVLRGQISVGMFLSWRMRWETVWAGFYQYALYHMMYWPIGLPPCSSFWSID
jgi:hypothetical protein